MTKRKQNPPRSAHSKSVSERPKTELQLLMPHETDDCMVKHVVDDTLPAHEQEQFFTAYMTLISQTRRHDISMTENQMILYSMKRKECTPSECVDAFWKAFDDPYVPASGIEWRHIAKHIDDARDLQTGEHVYNHALTDDEIDALRSKQGKEQDES